MLFTLTSCNTIDKSPDAAIDDLEYISEMVEDTEIKMYEGIVVDFEELSIASIGDTLRSSDDATQHYFYFGRTTCSYCRKFVIENVEPLSRVKHFYYIDTANFSEEESSILSEYGIDLIPAILTATNNDDIELTDIDAFIKDINQ